MIGVCNFFVINIHIPRPDNITTALITIEDLIAFDDLSFISLLNSTLRAFSFSYIAFAVFIHVS
ncbi:hypothetical protein Q5M85_01960 [Paraclostridium bifermentans]|nr:hypothetical protein [Paraclostridium bifermentans]